MSDFKTNGAAVDYAYGRWLVRYRWAVIVVVLAAALAAMAGVARLAVNPDNRVFFSKDNPHLLALEELENVYSKDNNVLFVLAPKDGDVFTRDTLAAIEDLTQRAWQLPYSQRVGSITNFQHTRADGDDLAVSNLVRGARELSDDQLAEIRAIALSRPTLVNNVIAESGAVTSVNAIIVLPSKDINEVPETAAVARRMAADFRAKYPDIDLYLTGGIMINLAFSEVPEQDMATLVPIMFGLVLLILGVSLRTALDDFLADKSHRLIGELNLAGNRSRA